MVLTLRRNERPWNIIPKALSISKKTRTKKYDERKEEKGQSTLLRGIMKTFKELLVGLAEADKEKETDAEYNLRMRKTTKTLKRSARKSTSKRAKKRNSIRRRTVDKIATAARQKAKRDVLGDLGKMKPSTKRKKVAQKAKMIDLKTRKLKMVLKQQQIFTVYLVQQILVEELV